MAHEHKARRMDSMYSRSLTAAGFQNESMLVLRREGVEQLTTGGISHSTENNANLPPSVARERGQGYYHKLKECFAVIWEIKSLFSYRCSSLLLGIINTTDCVGSFISKEIKVIIIITAKGLSV